MIKNVLQFVVLFLIIANDKIIKKKIYGTNQLITVAFCSFCFLQNYLIIIQKKNYFKNIKYKIIIMVISFMTVVF